MSTFRSRSMFKVAVVVPAMLVGLAGMSGAQEAQSKAPLGKHGHDGHRGHHGNHADSRQTRLVGMDALQARSAYQPTIHKQNGRYIAYVGHHAGEAMNPLTGDVEPNGTSIVDVTNPRKPKYLHHIPAHDGQDSSQMAQVCSGSQLPGGARGTAYLLRPNGGDGHEVYDVSDPSSPEHVSTLVTGLNDTHKGWWECSTGIAYVVSGAPGWKVDRMLQIYDLSDPAHPVHIRDFGLPGTQPGGHLAGRRMTDLHEPLYHNGRVYMSYGTSSGGILQVLDNDKLLHGDFHPKRPTDKELIAPEIGRLDWPDFQGVHTAVPMLGMKVPEFEDFAEGSPRDFVGVVGEATSNECSGPMEQFVHMTDITDVAHPIVTSTFFVPEDKGDFCERGGRFGSHTSQWNLTENHYRKRIMWVSYFNAGVRAVDIRDPYNLKEVAHYVPAVTKNTVPTDGKTVIQTNNVEVDDRGFVYIVDRANSGMHILYPTGHTRRIANLPPLRGRR